MGRMNQKSDIYLYELFFETHMIDYNRNQAFEPDQVSHVRFPRFIGAGNNTSEIKIML
jgi:hypothetical protein